MVPRPGGASKARTLRRSSDYHRDMSDPPSPTQRLAAQAARCRRAWRRLDPVSRRALADRLTGDGRRSAAVWAAVLRGEHPLAAWLDGDEEIDVLPALLDGGLPPRQLFHDHPFASLTPWSNLPMSPASSSTPRG